MASVRDLLSSSRQDSSVESTATKPMENGGIVTETTRFIIEFILDLVCPYCYIALKNLDAAIKLYTARHPDAVFEVVCTPFLLDPLAARSVYDKANYLQGRSLQPHGHNNDHFTRMAEAAGIDFSWKGLTGNTRDAHKLLRFALEPTPTPTAVRSTAFVTGGAHAPTAPLPPRPAPTTSPSPPPPPPPPPPARGPALQLALLAALLAAHHTSDADLSDRDFLAAVGASVLDVSPRALRAAVLESEAWTMAVDALAADARRGRSVAIAAVPTLVVNDRYVIGGAQDAGFLVNELERIRRAGMSGLGRRRGRGQEQEQEQGQEQQGQQGQQG
ncbi:hypothetical protein F4818DRAFT_338588 [Hypoxylon cercidicola]|nr:hypothetical protein F4818DRAFT_338588 [Hypoxylon cercidicola]